MINIYCAIRLEIEHASFKLTFVRMILMPGS